MSWGEGHNQWRRDRNFPDGIILEGGGGGRWSEFPGTIAIAMERDTSSRVIDDNRNHADIPRASFLSLTWLLRAARTHSYRDLYPIFPRWFDTCILYLETDSFKRNYNSLSGHGSMDHFLPRGYWNERKDWIPAEISRWRWWDWLVE